MGLPAGSERCRPRAMDLVSDLGTKAVSVLSCPDLSCPSRIFEVGTMRNAQSLCPHSVYPFQTTNKVSLISPCRLLLFSPRASVAPSPIFPFYLTWQGRGAAVAVSPLAPRFHSQSLQGALHPCSRPRTPGWDPMSSAVTLDIGRGCDASQQGLPVEGAPLPYPGRYLGYSRPGLPGACVQVPSRVRARIPAANWRLNQISMGPTRPGGGGEKPTP
jgi:hypothetical protein